jgi:WD40 repeat protein/uncharacterized caspase-like protein
MFSPVADTLAIGAKSTLRVFDLKTGNEEAKFDVSAGEEVRPTTWDELGIRPSPGFYTIDSLTFSPDGRFVVCGTFPRKRPSPCPLKIYDLKNRLAMETTSVRPPQVYSATFSPQGSLLATAAGEHIKLWDLNSGAVSGTLDGYDEINAVAFNPVDNVLVSASDAYRTRRNRIVRWDMAAQKMIGSEDFTSLPEAGIDPISRTSAHIKSLAISSDGKMLATGSSGHGQLVIIWDAGSGSAKLALKGQDRGVSAVAFSPDNTILASGSLNHDAGAGVVNLWKVSSGKLLKKLNASAPLTFDPTSKVLATSDAQGGVKLWKAPVWNSLNTLSPQGSSITSLIYSPNGGLLLGGLHDGRIVVWNVAHGYQPTVFAGHVGSVRSMSFRQRDNMLATIGDDATVRLWRLDAQGTLLPICSLFAFENGAWAVVSPEGSFDTNDVEQIEGLHWVFKDDPFRTLPAQVFMRDYYEPRLLPRLLKGSKFKPLRSLERVNRARPAIKIIEIRQHTDDPALVSVTVEASEQEYQSASGVSWRSGVHDLRIFREGQVVGYEPRSSDPQSNSSDDELANWRSLTEFQLDPVMGKTRTFEVILPKNRDLNEVVFSAYAFNKDRVKSETDKVPYKLPKPIKASEKGTAYLINIGVAESQNSRWNLFFPANDARAMQKDLYEALSTQYDKVVRVPLISDYGGIARRVGSCAERKPTKDAIKSVLDLLAGRQVEPERKQLIPCGDQIQKAKPGDLVLISFSGHGYGDGLGNFYIFPFDTGEPESSQPATSDINRALMRRLISSEDLSAWLRDVDAGDIIMVLDACQSEDVTGKDFKPGPMGSRGLGQLAYDKGMRIVVATQADNQAVGVGSLSHGLLTYALTKEGLETIGNTELTARAWVAAAIERVPRLYQEKVPKAIQNSGKIQQPSVFDFARKDRDLIIVRGTSKNN